MNPIHSRCVALDYIAPSELIICYLGVQELLGRPPNPDALMRTLFGNSESSPVEESSQLSSEGDSDSEEDEVTGT